MTDTDTSARIAQIRARHAAATPGNWRIATTTETTTEGEETTAVGVETDWEHCDGQDDMLVFLTGDPEYGITDADAEFTAHAHQDIPWLLDQLAWARAEANQYRTALQGVARRAAEEADQ